MALPEVREVFEAMPRVDALVCHPRFALDLAHLEELERDRPWCRHGLSHLLDVARIMWIAVLEHGWDASAGHEVAGVGSSARDACDTGTATCEGGAGTPLFTRDVIYATALLHDMGRVAQYETGEPHHAAGQRYARELLGELAGPERFTAAETEAIVYAVGAHRSCGAGASAGPAAEALANLLRASDKAARACWACSARATCAWPLEKRNEGVRA